MTETEFRERIDSMIETEYEAIGGDKFKQQVGEAAIRKLVISAYSKRLNAELERDPEFHAAWCLNVAGEDVQRYISERRPVGAYRQDGILKLGDNSAVFMPEATRDHLLAWALWEDDERNLAYAKSRLDAWDEHPECKTLDQLERAVFGWRPES
jgi:hypothetical protein